MKRRTTTAHPRCRHAAVGLLTGLLAFAGCRDDASGTSDSDTDSAGTGTEGPDTMQPSSGADTESETEDTTDDTTGGVGDDFIPGPGGMRKLTSREYTNSISLILGDAAGAAADPPADIGQEGFDAVGASILPLPADTIELYERSATAVAQATIENLGTLQDLVPCVAEDANPACYREVATTVGRFAFRRTLTDEEIERIAGVGAEGQAWGEGAFLVGLRYELMAILQAPSFLYIQEVGESGVEGDYRRLKPTELATRMSFFLTGHTPSLDLLDAAEAGMLDTPDQIRARAETMVADPAARVALDTFFGEALRLRDLASAPKNAEIFPEFTPQLGEFMKDETLLLIYDIVWNRDGDYRELFNASHTFVNDDLAALYGMEPPGTGPIFTQVDWPEDQLRAGYTSQASFLTWQSGPRRNSPTKRGLYVQERILCADIPPPDPNAELDLPENDDLTLKELLEMHLDQDGCRSCHGLMDPIGFAFERYTAIGGFRTMDNGQPVETDGEVVGLGMWNDARELGNVLAEDPRTGPCLIENLMRGTLGRSPGDDEEPAIEDLGALFADSGYSVQSLLVEMTAHPLFRLVDEPK